MRLPKRQKQQQRNAGDLQTGEGGITVRPGAGGHGIFRIESGRQELLQRIAKRT